ncbi:MAG: hypothetical protein HUU15_09270 [Candidatus Brocadiae bacterium]|nr:hypothetical protein [Candidatus Brocadiia bacterium]
MKKYLPLALAAGALAAVVLHRPAIAEDGKPGDTDVFDNDTFGVKVTKPKGKDQWKIVGAGAWEPTWFKDDDGVVFLFTKWAADNPNGDPQKSPPLVRVYGFRYDTMGKFKIGTWEGSPTSTKGFAKALFEDLTTNDYKNLKNTKETAKRSYPCGDFYEFSTYGEHKKYGGSHYLRVMVGKRDSKDTYQLVVACAPGEEKMDGKHSGEEIEMILRSIRYYDKK